MTPPTQRPDRTLPPGAICIETDLEQMQLLFRSIERDFLVESHSSQTSSDFQGSYRICFTLRPLAGNSDRVPHPTHIS